MWLPTRVYELLPTFYIVVGLTFLAGSAYIESYHKLATMYFALGVVSVLCGLIVGQRRLNSRRPNQPSEENRQA